MINPNKKSASSSANKGGGGGGGVNTNNISTTAAARGGAGGMYGMAGEESVDELSDDDEYGSQDPRNDMPDWLGLRLAIFSPHFLGTLFDLFFCGFAKLQKIVTPVRHSPLWFLPCF